MTLWAQSDRGGVVNRRTVLKGMGAVTVAGVLGTTPAFGAQSSAPRQAAKFFPEERAPFSFGRALAVDRDTVLAGSPNSSVGNVILGGAAYVYSRTADGWQRTAKLTRDDAVRGLYFGDSVALDGNTAVVGVRLGSESGATATGGFIYERRRGVWRETARLTIPNVPPSIAEGSLEVAVDGRYAVVASLSSRQEIIDDGPAGVWVFERKGGEWRGPTRLLPESDLFQSNFGRSVAVDGGTIVVGAPTASEVGRFTGAVYMFERSGADWVESPVLTSSNAVNFSFGSSVALDGRELLVGAPEVISDPGRVYAFRRSGQAWELAQQFSASPQDAAAGFGSQVALDGRSALVGAPNPGSSRSFGGSTFLYDRVRSSWQRRQEVSATDTVAGDLFGAAVGLDRRTLAIGSYNARKPTGEQTGAVYIFDR